MNGSGRSAERAPRKYIRLVGSDVGLALAACAARGARHERADAIQDDRGAAEKAAT